MRITRRAAGWLTAANLVSLTRIPLAALFLLLPGRLERSLILAAAAASDFLDGWLARKGADSRVGEVLDPATDKIFVVVALIAFHPAALGAGQLAILLARDALALAAAAVVWLLGLPLRMRARWSGKTVTVLQLAAVLVLLLAPGWIGPLVVVVGAASLWAVVDYGLAGARKLRGSAARS